MSRRRFLGALAASAATLGCGAAPVAHRSTPAVGGTVRAVAFDLFTLFDPRGVQRRIAEVLPDAPAGFEVAWRTRLFEYAWIRAASGRYVDFRQLTGDALDHGASAAGVHLAPPDREALIEAYTELEPWPDTEAVLDQLRARGLRLAPLANYTPAMIEALLGRAGLRRYFEVLVSTDEARTYKPDPLAYRLGVERLGLEASEIAFSAFGGWDAAGATWFGYPTFWVNRLGAAEEVLVSPEASGPSLVALADWLAVRAS
jgi:2-haloacid dehalogenase